MDVKSEGLKQDQNEDGSEACTEMKPKSKLEDTDDSSKSDANLSSSQNKPTAVTLQMNQLRNVVGVQLQPAVSGQGQVVGVPGLVAARPLRMANPRIGSNITLSSASRQPPPAHCKQPNFVPSAFVTTPTSQARIVLANISLPSNAGQLPGSVTAQAVLVPQGTSTSGGVKQHDKLKTLPNGALPTPRRAHKSLTEERRYCNMPNDVVGHTPGKSRRVGANRRFYNPAPRRNPSTNSVHTEYPEHPCTKMTFTRLARLKRSCPHGAGYLSEAQMNTPPPAHCNPGRVTATAVTAKPISVKHAPAGQVVPIVNNASTSFRAQMPVANQTAKKPKLVSDFLALQNSTKNIAMERAAMSAGVR